MKMPDEPQTTRASESTSSPRASRVICRSEAAIVSPPNGISSSRSSAHRRRRAARRSEPLRRGHEHQEQREEAEEEVERDRVREDATSRDRRRPPARARSRASTGGRRAPRARFVRGAIGARDSSTRRARLDRPHGRGRADPAARDHADFDGVRPPPARGVGPLRPRGHVGRPARRDGSRRRPAAPRRGCVGRGRRVQLRVRGPRREASRTCTPTCSPSCRGPAAGRRPPAQVGAARRGAAPRPAPRAVDLRPDARPQRAPQPAPPRRDRARVPARTSTARTRSALHHGLRHRPAAGALGARLARGRPSRGRCGTGDGRRRAPAARGRRSRYRPTGTQVAADPARAPPSSSRASGAPSRKRSRAATRRWTSSTTRAVAARVPASSPCAEPTIHRRVRPGGRGFAGRLGARLRRASVPHARYAVSSPVAAGSDGVGRPLAPRARVERARGGPRGAAPGGRGRR